MCCVCVDCGIGIPIFFYKKNIYVCMYSFYPIDERPLTFAIDVMLQMTVNVNWRQTIKFLRHLKGKQKQKQIENTFSMVFTVYNYNARVDS